ncbi:cytochrome P450 [Aneurinibacillus migulanus]|uniref:cytochrome P450 n=1 Tax=Aneurinibacillus migulanus TaxID=47500 RepID=UPI002E235F7F|nr:cytochrome P450 [Aneurinibacillus migulanus]MED4732204.1 cytochrome P450 [Aneurinibacillus migulanus]
MITDENLKKEKAIEIPAIFSSPKGLSNAPTPFDWYKEMRENNPVWFDPERNCWDVFLYDDVKKVLSDYESFSSKLYAQTGIAESIISQDPPKHRLYRSIISKAFTPKSVEGLTPRIHEITNELLDHVVDKGEMDIIADFAYPLPVIVIAELLGVPKEDREMFKHWSDELVRSIDSDQGETPEEYMKRRERNKMELFNYFEKVVADKRINPSQDLITALLEAQVEDKSLTLPELLHFCLLLLVAGNETTTNLIGNAVSCFTEDEHLQRQLRSEPSLLPNAIEEVLRYYSPIQTVNRICVHDTELSGQTIKANQPVLLWLGSANRDENKFKQPDQFMMDRSPNPHLAFGNGPHFCLGAPLARLEAIIAMSLLLERLPFFSRKDSELSLYRNPVIYGFKKFPVTLGK